VRDYKWKSESRKTGIWETAEYASIHFLSSFQIKHDDGLVLLPSVTGFSSIMEIP
jgi:hypothetical protein